MEHKNDSLLYMQAVSRVNRSFDNINQAVVNLGKGFAMLSEVFDSWHKNLMYEQCKKANLVREHFVYQKFQYEHLEHQVNIRIAALNIAFSEYLNKIYKS